MIRILIFVTFSKNILTNKAGGTQLKYKLISKSQPEV